MWASYPRAVSSMQLIALPPVAGAEGPYVFDRKAAAFNYRREGRALGEYQQGAHQEQLEVAEEADEDTAATANRNDSRKGKGNEAEPESSVLESLDIAANMSEYLDDQSLAFSDIFLRHITPYLDDLLSTSRRRRAELHRAQRQRQAQREESRQKSADQGQGRPGNQQHLSSSSLSSTRVSVQTNLRSQCTISSVKETRTSEDYAFEEVSPLGTVSRSGLNSIHKPKKRQTPSLITPAEAAFKTALSQAAAIQSVPSLKAHTAEESFTLTAFDTPRRSVAGLTIPSHGASNSAAKSASFAAAVAGMSPSLTMTADLSTSEISLAGSERARKHPGSLSSAFSISTEILIPEHQFPLVSAAQRDQSATVVKSPTTSNSAARSDGKGGLALSSSSSNNRMNTNGGTRDVGSSSSETGAENVPARSPRAGMRGSLAHRAEQVTKSSLFVQDPRNSGGSGGGSGSKPRADSSLTGDIENEGSIADSIDSLQSTSAEQLQKQHQHHQHHDQQQRQQQHPNPHNLPQQPHRRRQRHGSQHTPNQRQQQLTGGGNGGSYISSNSSADSRFSPSSVPTRARRATSDGSNYTLASQSGGGGGGGGGGNISGRWGKSTGTPPHSASPSPLLFGFSPVKGDDFDNQINVLERYLTVLLLHENCIL